MFCLSALDGITNCTLAPHSVVQIKSTVFSGLEKLFVQFFQTTCFDIPSCPEIKGNSKAHDQRSTRAKGSLRGFLYCDI